MKEIKFRAWDNENKCFFQPTYEAYKGNLQDLHISLKGTLAMRTLQQFIHCDSMMPDRFVLEQFTGLKDKNGKEIYERDIVSCLGWQNVEVKFKANTFYPLTASYDNRNMRAEEWEVIGNIHENPELLET